LEFGVKVGRSRRDRRCVECGAVWSVELRQGGHVVGALSECEVVGDDA